MTRRTILICTLLVLTGLPALAHEPPTRPVREPGERRFRSPYGRDFENDVREAEAFMQENSPNRFSMYELLPDDAPQKRMIRRFIAGFYRQLMDEKQNDADSYELSLKQIGLDDEIFAIVREYRRAPEESADRKKAREDLKSAMGDWVDNSLALRLRRIDRLEKALEREKKRLQSDRDRREAFVEERVQKVLTDKSDPDRPEFRPEGPPPMMPSP